MRLLLLLAILLTSLEAKAATLAQAVLYSTDTSGTNARPSAITITPSTSGTNLLAGTLTSTNDLTVGNNASVGGTLAVTGQLTNSALQASQLVYGSAAKVLSSISSGNVGDVLTSGGAGVAPSFNAPTWAPATSGTSILKGNGSGGTAAAAAGTDFVGPTSGSAIQKADGAGGLTPAVPNTDYAPVTDPVFHGSVTLWSTNGLYTFTITPDPNLSATTRLFLGTGSGLWLSSLSSTNETVSRIALDGNTNHAVRGDGSVGSIAGSLPQNLGTSDSPTFAGLTAPTGRGASYLVATASSPAKDRAQADWLCDGSDDQEQIQAALDAIASAGGGALRIAAGTYSITTNILFSGKTTIVGDGHATILQAGTNLNGSILKSNGRVNRCHLRNFDVDGNTANQSASGTGIEFDGYYSLFQGLWVTGCKTYGFNYSSTTSSGSSMFEGGRYEGDVSGLYMASGATDFVIHRTIFASGVDSVNIRGGGGKLSDCIFFSSSGSNLKIGGASVIENCRFSSAPIGIYVDGATNNVIGIWSGLQIVNPLFSAVTDHDIYETVGSGDTSYLTVVGWTGPSSNAELSLDGAGTHRVKVISSYQDIRAELLSTGMIYSESYIAQPEFSHTSVPSNPVLGMVYLDSGANTATGLPGKRRYNGSAWVDQAMTLTPSVTQESITGQTWASISGTTPTAGTIKFASDLGSGAFVTYVGSRWKPLNGRATLAMLGASVSSIANAETTILQTVIPAGMWQNNDLIRVELICSKSGATDTGDATVRIGTSGTTSDTAVTLNNTAIMAASGRSWEGWLDFKLFSATSVKKIGGTGSVSTGVGSSTGAAQSSVTISSASANALYITIALQSGGTNDTLTADDCAISWVTP